MIKVNKNYRNQKIKKTTPNTNGNTVGLQRNEKKKQNKTKVLKKTQNEK